MTTMGSTDAQTMATVLLMVLPLPELLLLLMSLLRDPPVDVSLAGLDTEVGGASGMGSWGPAC